MSTNHYIGGRWVEGEGHALKSIDPSTGNIIWTGKAATAQEVRHTVDSARKSYSLWRSTPLEKRIQKIETFREQLELNKQELSETISQETGKPLWEAKTEVGAMIRKIDISIDAHQQRTGEIKSPLAEAISFVRHKPHGVLVVFGPYNFPGHLPNGHIVPALLAGNTVIFKPSEKTPLVAQKTMEYWEKTELPDGVINLLQGVRTTGEALLSNSDINGVLFTGSAQTGHLIHQQFGGHPEKVLALEMGGNNPLIVTEVDNVEAAVHHTVQSAYITSGQRCTCARRLIILSDKEGDNFLDHLLKVIKTIKVGVWSDQPEPFMGPVIDVQSAEQLLQHQNNFKKIGGTVLIEMKQLKPKSAFLSPGLIDITGVQHRPDIEIFGPLLQVIRVNNFQEALDEANNTSYGLSAGLLSSNKKLYQQFYDQIQAGIVNWNRPITGASSGAPFGGIGASGNYRPSAWYAADYCSYPVSSLENDQLITPKTLPPGIG